MIYLTLLGIDMSLIENRIKEIAVKHSGDYPDIENCDPIEQLWAIECSIEGTDLANIGLHKIIVGLGKKLGVTDRTELYKLCLEIQKEQE